MKEVRNPASKWVVPGSVGLVATVLLLWSRPESPAVLALVPMAVSLAAAAFIGRRGEAAVGSVGSVDLGADSDSYVSLNQCQLALSAAGVGAWIWDLDAEELHCTKDVFKILGCEIPKPKVTADEFKVLVHADDQLAFRLAVEGVVGGTRRSSFDCRFVRPGGGIVWVELSMSLLENGSGHLKIAGAMTDVTERKHVEAQLDRGSAYLEALLENTENIVFSIDSDFRLTVLNSRFVCNFRASYGKRLHLGDDLLEVSPVEEANVWKPRFERALAGESLRVEEVFVIKKKRYYFDVSLKPIREHGLVVGASAYSRNITKQKKREKEWIRAKERAEESDRLKSAFLANMSHEIRTPLNAVMGFAQLLKSEDASEEEKRRFVDIILSNGEHLLHILGDIIDLAKIESDQIQVDLAPFDLGLTMAEVYSVFRERIKTNSEGLVELVIDSQMSNPDVIVCDETRLKQVIYNLVANAVKFTLQGSIKVGYRRMDDSVVEFFVSDTGSGIPEGMRNSVFKRFRQGKDHTGRRNDGVGLGLSICKGLVDLLDGNIWVEENLPHGSVFKFTVRDHVSRAEDPMPEPELADAPSKKVEQGLLSSQCKILVAEDDEMNFRVLEEFLRYHRLEAVRALNGVEAIEAVKKDADIRLVFMDLSMPVLGGIEATREIKSLRPELPVIAHTAHAMKHELDRALAAGCSDCLVKPIEISNFNALLHRYFKRNDP